MIYSKSTEVLKKAGIEYFSLEIINDKVRIEELNKALYNSENLPLDIEKKKRGEVIVSNQDLYEGKMQTPNFIVRKQLTITDEEEVQKIREYKKTHQGSNPSGISARIVRSHDSTEIKSYYHTSKYAFYKVEYDYYERIPLTDEEISFRISATNAHSLTQISSTLLFFKYLVITIIILNILFALILLSY